jgi:hypothetical protein
MRNLVWMLLFVLAFGFVASWTILGALGVAVAQSITQQQEVIQDLANVVAANEECGFTADESVIGAFLDRHGLRLETMAGELAFADRLNAARLNAALQASAQPCRRTRRHSAYAPG